MGILEDLKQRGIFNDVTNEEKLKNLPKGAGVYIGFDPTANSLHLGNYIQIAILQKFQKAGFNPIAVLGGATGMIGDPSGKSQERTLLNDSKLLENKKAIKAQLEKYGLKVVDNYDFYKDMTIIDFLREVGKLLNVNYMINKDVVKSRLETGISFTEFSYQLIQGWDFKTLYKEHDVHVQVGGSDQWGNITSGIEIIRKTIGDDHTAVGLTTKLLTTSSGEKFGKSAGNALFISKELTSPFEIYQYLLNTTDTDVERLLYWTTSLEIQEVVQIMKTHNESPKDRFAQKQLAKTVVEDIHSSKDAEGAVKITEALFGSGEIASLPTELVLQLEGVVPTTTSKGGSIIEFLVEAKAAQSNREAREFISNGAIEINGTKVDDLEFKVVPTSFDKKATVVRRGKKKFFLVKHI